MLLSMTGHGEGYRQQDGFGVGVEIRTINSRYFKFVLRSPENDAALEARIEAAVRQQVRRGTVQINLKIDREASSDDYRVNEVVLQGYRENIEKMTGESLGPHDVVSMMSLPGVISDQTAAAADTDRLWTVLNPALQDALTALMAMRREEGSAMAADLRQNCQLIATELDKIENRAPKVVAAYQQRLTDKLTQLLGEYDVNVQAADVVREVGMFADRCDISEEFVRLRSHLSQYATIMQAAESSGRKLDFLTQELLRETNTIGSKANDAEIAMHVVDIKTAIERIREMIQNIE